MGVKRPSTDQTKEVRDKWFSTFKIKFHFSRIDIQRSWVSIIFCSGVEDDHPGKVGHAAYLYTAQKRLVAIRIYVLEPN